MHHARRAARHRRFREHRRQLVFAERHLDVLDRLLAADEAAREDFDAALVGIEPSRILVARHALGQQIVDARAQILASSRERMLRLLVGASEALHALGELHPALEPRALLCLVAVQRLDAGDLPERPARFVDLGYLAAAVQRGHDREAPRVVVGEVLEHHASFMR